MNLRPFSTALLAPALVLTITTAPAGGSELDVEEVLARHVEAKGGAQAWKGVESLRWTGSYGAFGYASPFTLTRQRPARMRFDTANKDGDAWISAHDGEVTWTINPFLATPWAVEMNTVDAAVFAAETDFDGPLFDAAAKGHQVRLEGVVDFDGIDAYKIVLTRAGGGEEEWYLDKETFLEVARIAPASDFGRPIETGRTYFMDFRPVEGLMLPHRIEKEYSTRFRSYDLATVEVNPPLEAESFQLPLSNAMAALAPLAGDWQVRMEWATRPGAPWGEAVTTASVEEAFHGGLLRMELSFVQAGQPRKIFHTWSYDRFREVYLETAFDSFSFRHSLMEGTMEDGRLVTSSIDSGTFLETRGQKIHTRRTTSGIGPDGFEVLREISTDGGESWQENLRMTFRRPADG